MNRPPCSLPVPTHSRPRPGSVWFEEQLGKVLPGVLACRCLSAGARGLRFPSSSPSLGVAGRFCDPTDPLPEDSGLKLLSVWGCPLGAWK